MEVDLIFTNTLDVPSLEMTYALLDGDGGTCFFTGTRSIDLARANEQFRITDNTGEDVPPNIEEATIGCRVLAVEERASSVGDHQSPTDADICTVKGGSSSESIQIELAVTSPFEDTTNVLVYYALQAPGPVRFETYVKAVDLVGAGESIRISVNTLKAGPGWIGDGEVACAVLAVRAVDF